VDYIGHPMHNHSSTSFLGSLFVPVFRIHLLHGKVAVFVFKATMVQGEKFAKDLTLDLLDKVIDRIAINKGALFGIVSMEVEVERKPIVAYEVIGQFLYGIDSRLF
jgi:hypothetical protein